jgi:hypothetical protein
MDARFAHRPRHISRLLIDFDELLLLQQGDGKVVIGRVNVGHNAIILILILILILV